MKLFFVDVKSEGQVVSEALAQTFVAIEQSQKGEYKVLKILHGYGSHGTGGEIKKNILIALNLHKKQKRIKQFFCADSINQQSREILVDLCPELYIDKDLYNLNAGVTFVIV